MKKLKKLDRLMQDMKPIENDKDWSIWWVIAFFATWGVALVLAALGYTGHY